MNGRSLRGLQSLFSKPSFVLWTTTGCRDGDPYANMMIGLGRSAMLESRSTIFQFADLAFAAQPNLQADILSKMLLRMVNISLPEYKDVLWSQESELTVINGEIHLPRLLPDEERNLRLNSGMREIYQNAPADSTNLTIVVRESHLSLEHALEHGGASDFPGYLEIAVRESSVFMVSPCESEFFHLCVGVVVGTDHRVLALSRASLSVIRVLPERVFYLTDDWSEAELLQYTLKTILCEDFFHVEIRFWFLKELETDIPILQILGGVSLRDICQDALLRISSSSTKTPKPARTSDAIQAAKGESPAQDIQH
ncbi:hypothetical protein F4823DRAFT_569389 [Ustulina deusta]|nr:hypothetical protein F4823DRAFT_569389 [Ustulina deusta]